MNIIVCVKQVPEIALIMVDDSAKRIVYPSGPGMTNPFDDYAVEEALRIKEKTSGKVYALSLGNQNAEPALRNCLALGVDEAVLLTVPEVNYLDSYTAAFILAQGIKKISNYDLILCGKQAVDGDSSLMPPALAEWLGLPEISFVKKFENITPSSATVFRMTEEGYDVVEVSLPAIVSVVKEINEPRLPSLKGKMRAKSAPLLVWGKEELGLEEDKITGQSSLTRMSCFMSPPPRPKGEMIAGQTPVEQADNLVAQLREAQVI
jgi:electron transfer flavoprotein beta subunit